MQESAVPPSRIGWAVAAALVACVAFLPFLRGTLLGNAFFFRDLSRHYFPSRSFTVDGLRQGELRHWNPLVHEGKPAPPPISYPVDVLQTLWPGESGLSLSLALHVPFAAVAFLLLARQLGTGPVGAAVGAASYALGGFSLSSLNLYVHLQALAWAPLVVLGLLRSTRGGGRGVAGGALATAMGLSTFGVEIIAQAALFGVALSAADPKTDRRAWARLFASLMLALGLAAPLLLYLSAQTGGGARAGGLPPDAVLAFSMHPMTFVQTVVAGLYSDPSDPLNRYWGGNFSASFPYFLSFYLGAGALCLAAVGATTRRFGRPLLLWTAVAIWICLGAFGRLDVLLELVPALRALRYPAKAFFTIHLAVAVLAAVGADALARERRPWRTAGLLASGLGMGLVALRVLPWLFPEATRGAMADFFPPSVDWPSRAGLVGFILDDAARGGLACLACVPFAALVLRHRLAPGRGALAVGLLVAADLLRAGAGLNPMVTPGFYRVSGEVSRIVPALRNGRIFTCDASLGRTLAAGLARQRDRYEAWSHGVLLESLLPSFNVSVGLRSALSRDLTMLVPERYVLGPQDAGCVEFGSIAGRLRRAGVSHLLSVDPIAHEDLALHAALRPPRIAPLSLFVYEIRGSLPLRQVASSVRVAADAESAESIAREPGFLAGGGAAVEGASGPVNGARGSVLETSDRSDEVRLLVEADRPTVVVVRDGWAPGWRARVNGAPADVLRSDGRHRAVEVGAGRSEVILRYEPPRRAAGLALLAVSLGAVVALLRRG